MSNIIIPHGLDNNGLVQRSRVVEGIGVDDAMASLGTKTRVRILEGNKVLWDGHNTTVLGGRLALLEKQFGIIPDETNHLTLNNMMGITHDQSSKAFAASTARSCLYFMAGNGAASTSVPGKVYSAKNYETKLYKPIPFRFVPVASDLSDTEKAQYRLRKIITLNGTDYVAYYAKKFDPGVINLEYNDATYLPQESDTTPVDENDSSHRLAGGNVLAYIQFTLTILQTELKEYFRAVNGSLSGASMSEIGLVYGADLEKTDGSNSYMELAGAELFAKVTSSAVALDTEGSSRVVEYRIYAR